MACCMAAGGNDSSAAVAVSAAQVTVSSVSADEAAADGGRQDEAEEAGQLGRTALQTTQSGALSRHSVSDFYHVFFVIFVLLAHVYVVHVTYS